MNKQQYNPLFSSPEEPPEGKPTDLVKLELRTMVYADICDTTELPVYTEQVNTW